MLVGSLFLLGKQSNHVADWFSLLWVWPSSNCKKRKAVKTKTKSLTRVRHCNRLRWTGVGRTDGGAPLPSLTDGEIAWKIHQVLITKHKT